MDIERRLYLRLFSFCIGRAMEILSYFIDTCVLNHSDFDSFLNLLRNKHKMFHRWLSKTPCCECIKSVSIAAPNKGSVLNEAQLKTIYKLDGTEVAGHAITNTKGHTNQHCLCKVTAIAGITTENLDIALVHCLVKTCDPATFSKIGTHIEVIRSVRNGLAHPSQGGMMSEVEFNSKWKDVENALLAISKEVSTSYERHAQKLITPLKSLDVNLKDILDKVHTIEDSMKHTITDILQGHTRIDELLILRALDKQKDDLYILIKQLLFEVNLKGVKAESTQGDLESSGRKADVLICSHDTDEKSKQRQSGGKQRVMWRLETPDEWNVERMKQKLEQVAALLSPDFCVEFIYAGSLVIQTSVSLHILRDRQLLNSAIRLFLEKIVEVCEIDTDIKQTVAVEFNVLDMDLDKETVERLTMLQQYGEMESSNDEDNVNCKYCNKRFLCDQCSDRRKQIKVLEEDIQKKTQTIADMKTERKKPKSKDRHYHRLQRKRSTDSIKAEAKESSEYKQCELCVSNPKPSVYWCKECTKALCKECNIVHHSQPVSSTHTTVLVSSDYNYQIKGINITDIAVLCDGELIMGDWKSEHLIICNIKGQNKKMIPLPYTPWRHTILNINSVAVTTVNNKTVLIVDVKNKIVTHQIDINKYCSGIVHTINNLYVGCKDKSLVVLDMSGEVIRTVPLSFIPRYICSGTEGRIYCTDIYRDTVYCIDTEGNTVFTVTNPDMSRPTGITTDNEGHVLVVCDGSNNVHMISPDGKQCNVIITGIPVSVSYPFICYDSVSKSIVIGRGDNVYGYKI